jgi:hypothetical protein
LNRTQSRARNLAVATANGWCFLLAPERAFTNREICNCVFTTLRANHAVQLDGGGSAQLFENARTLMPSSDRGGVRRVPVWIVVCGAPGRRM